jgi:glycosyltransferase involved in cell wall biosynthesis
LNDNHDSEIRLACFLPSLEGGGAERVVVNLLRGLVERQVQAQLILASAHGSYLDQVPSQVEVVDLGVRHIRQAIWPLRRLLKEQTPEVLISHLSHANLAAVLAMRPLEIPTRLLLVEHLTMSAYKGTTVKDRMIQPLARWLFKHADAVAAVSRGAARDLEEQLRMPSDSVHVLYNPVVDDSLEQKRQESLSDPWLDASDQPLVVGMGRLTEQKDFGTLIRAFAQIANPSSCRLVILGEGEERAELEELVRQLGLEERVLLPGFVKNPYAWLNQADLFVLSSRWEALPTVLIEALACGVKVVATDCPSGPAEILQDGRWGSLVPMQDEQALAVAMEQALSEQGDSGLLRQRAADFSVESAVDQYLALIRQLLANP